MTAFAIEIQKALDEINSGVHTVDGDFLDEANEHDEAMRRQIVTTPAYTLDGVLVKLRVAQEEPEVDVLEPVRLAINEVARDLERLVSGGVL